jgi:hypothetical protein
MSEYAIISRLFLSLNSLKIALSRQGFLGLSHRCCVALHRHKSNLQFETEFEVTLMLRNGGIFLLISKVTPRESNYIHVEIPEHLSSSSLFASILLSCWAVRFTCSLRIGSLADHLQAQLPDVSSSKNPNTRQLQTANLKIPQSHSHFISTIANLPIVHLIQSHHEPASAFQQLPAPCQQHQQACPKEATCRASNVLTSGQSSRFN